MRETTKPILIRTSKPETVRPLIKAALERQKDSLRHGLSRTRSRLQSFEERYGRSSDEFERRLISGEWEENLDATDWRMEIQMARLLEDQYNALMEAEIAE